MGKCLVNWRFPSLFMIDFGANWVEDSARNFRAFGNVPPETILYCGVNSWFDKGGVMANLLAGKRALVTGSASGIGAAIVGVGLLVEVGPEAQEVADGREASVGEPVAGDLNGVRLLALGRPFGLG